MPPAIQEFVRAVYGEGHGMVTPLLMTVAVVAGLIYAFVIVGAVFFDRIRLRQRS